MPSIVVLRIVLHPFFLGLRCWLCCPGIVGPVMARVTAHEFLLHGRIRALQESVEVLGDLYRTSGWTQQMEHQWLAAKEGCLPAAEEFLEPGGDNGNIPGFVVKPFPRSRGEQPGQSWG